MQRFRLERKQVRTPTEGLRSAGLAFKSEDEVISYPVGGRRRKPPEIITTDPEEQATAWSRIGSSRVFSCVRGVFDVFHCVSQRFLMFWVVFH